MGAGAILEPLTVIVLLFGGTWINRVTKTSTSSIHVRRQSAEYRRTDSSDSLESGRLSPSPKEALLSTRACSPHSATTTSDNRWHTRQLRVLGYTWSFWSPNSEVFQDRLLSRLLRKLPFLVECWYWALVYWTYQLGRAFTALTLKDDTVDVARRHALSVIEVEKSLGIFWEVDIQRFFLRHTTAMMWINWIYSFIHIPGTIAFLVWLYYYTTTRNRIDEPQPGKPRGSVSGSPAGPLLYQARRRTMAVCNLLAFVVFTLWPCMPPRLLSDPNVQGPEGELSRSYGFVDTVHGENGAGSVWTQNRFCNQYAAMPSLHFGYSLMIGVTIMTIPLPSHHRRSLRTRLCCGIGLRIPSWRRILCLTLGFLYPFTILVAIVATANHFILDAVAGALVCALGWNFNSILLNLLPFEDYFLWLVRIHKPEPASTGLYTKTFDDWDSDDGQIRQAVLPQ
ncbi:Integral membrane protein [Penicillium ucsense]|uniref:Integral membrane protein n=1 Tax=Penicillium ucsense TaxID=2839758 RepID=A0A8J8W7P2_9EURO|nr:Integral membrane protein [Penicillium ucsense]KAF7735285.1 Integral membrane protein [Penicillium ucsense]